MTLNIAWRMKMASITIKLGSLISTITATDAVATKVFSNYADAHSLAVDGTPQERLNATLRRLVLQLMNDVGEGHHENTRCYYVVGFDQVHLLRAGGSK